MKLYFKPGACSLSDHIALEWIGEPYEAQNVSEALKSPDFLKINPLGQVPVLDVDGWTLTQNVAILNFLADTFPQAELGGDGTARSRAEINRWLAFVNSDVHPAFKPMFGAYDYLDDEAVVAKATDHARETLRKLFELVNIQLEGKDWIVGSRSIVDPYLFVVLRWARAVKIDLDGFDNIQRFFKHMREDAGVQRALQTEGLK